MRVLVRVIVAMCLVGFASSMLLGAPARKTLNFELGPYFQLGPKDSPVREELAYQQLLRMIVSFAKEADKQAAQGHAERADYLRKYFEVHAGLSTDQFRVLKTFAQEVSSPSGCRPSNAPGNEQETRLYKARLRDLLGTTGISSLDRYLREKLIPRIGYSDFGNPQRPQSGFSTVDYIYNADEVMGYSYTQEPGGFCIVVVNQVSATLTSDNEGLVDSDSAEACDGMAEVFLYWPSPDPGDQLCIDGQHAYAENWVQMRGTGLDILGAEETKPDGYYCGYEKSNSLPPSYDCWTAPINGIQGVNFELIATDSPPIDSPDTDSNPNTDEGLRIFPDKNSQNDTVNRQTIRVKASSSNELPGRPIYFRAFDLDDPATNPAIDPDGDGNDNRGTVSGGTSAGKLSGTSATPNPQGIATVDFTVTMHPGDNFAIAASTDPALLEGATIDGINLKTAGGSLIESECDGTSQICRSNMLTIWRRLNIEVDSMGAADGNHVVGTTGIWRNFVIGPNETESFTVVPSSAPDLEPGRFQNGRFVVVGNGNTLFVKSNSAGNLLEVENRTSQPITMEGGVQFVLYDDDDFNDDDGVSPGDGTLDGDVQEDITFRGNNQFEQTFSKLKSSDDVDENPYAAAYIRPNYTWAESQPGMNDSNVQFQVAVTVTGDYSNERTIIDSVRDSTAFEADDFWVAYVLLAYQTARVQTTVTDGDPNGQVIGGVAPPPENSGAPWIDVLYIPSSLPSGSIGCLVYIENSRDQDAALATDYNVRGVPHEVGHQFGLAGDDPGFDIMSPTGLTSFVPDHINILRWRRKSPGQN
ncbi:MAG: hypothetical protein ABL999_10810 [Pyrinomonadaceae bacterium]